jgi:hypothetical protein
MPKHPNEINVFGSRGATLTGMRQLNGKHIHEMKGLGSRGATLTGMGPLCPFALARGRKKTFPWLTGFLSSPPAFCPSPLCPFALATGRTKSISLANGLPLLSARLLPFAPLPLCRFALARGQKKTFPWLTGFLYSPPAFAPLPICLLGSLCFFCLSLAGGLPLLSPRLLSFCPFAFAPLL